MYTFFFLFFFSSRRRHTRSLRDWSSDVCSSDLAARRSRRAGRLAAARSERGAGAGRPGRHAGGATTPRRLRDRKSTRLNSSHVEISYAVFCLKKKKKKK